jgi:hypothetical protein
MEIWAIYLLGVLLLLETILYFTLCLQQLLLKLGQLIICWEGNMAVRDVKSKLMHARTHTVSRVAFQCCRKP